MQSGKEVLRRTLTTRKTQPAPVCGHGRKSIDFGGIEDSQFSLPKSIAYACFVKNVDPNIIIF